MENNQALLDFNNFAGIEIRIRKSDGFMSATDMCKVNKKKLWSDYFRLKQTKEYIEALERALQICKAQLLESVAANMPNRGTWVHPRVAVHLAQWISPQFAVKVSEWIEEWYKSSDINYAKFLHEINNLKPSISSQQIEKKIQAKLAKKYNADVEIETEVGMIDMLTNTEIIEIKVASKWKHALGQIISYGEFYPSHKKKIILFGKVEVNIETIKKICIKFDVEVELHENDYA
jgi:hypothetical protein